MQGLKTQETLSFKNYWEIVQAKASSSDSIFFLDAGDGRSITIGNVEAEDVYGYLIPKAISKKFEALWISECDLEEYGKYYTLAKWTLHEGNILVDFRSF
ncbi:MAG: hypothetical protein LBN34_08550 [Clostridiales Family XIII bacterium]|jgi:hypothetical protein|nr:hypothetical protein [Clostridiales Family XIII bacterium]